MTKIRKQAPKRINGSHPSWYWLQSGGIDSTAAFLQTRRALHENYGKRPIMVYLDTRVGLPFNRLYVEQLADAYDEQLWTLRTHEKFEDRLAKRGKYADREDTGAPGSAIHSDVQNDLKAIQRKMLSARDDTAIYVTGIRAGESNARASFPKGEINHGERYVKPVYEMTKAQCAEVILREDAPINPGWWLPHYTDCGCGCNGDPSEYDEVKKRFPAFAQRLEEWQEAIPEDGVKSILGWSGLTAEERRARESGHRQASLSLCGISCNRRIPSPIERAFKARCFGASIEESVSILYDESEGWKEYPVDREIVPTRE